MGIDATFFIEIRKEGKWNTLSWKSPVQLHQFKHPEEKNKEWKTDSRFLWASFYAFEEFMADCDIIDGIPDDVGEPIKKCSKKEYRQCYGWQHFYFQTLVDYCDKKFRECMEELNTASEMKLHAQLNRIEKAVCGKLKTKDNPSENAEFGPKTVERTLKYFWDDYGSCIRLMWRVWHILDILGCEVNNEDIRIVFVTR